MEPKPEYAVSALSKFEKNRIFILNDPTAPRLSPALACEIGLNESIIFLQLDFWIATSGKKQNDGRWWVYESITDLQECFSFWSRMTINRAIKSLEKKGLILIGNYNKRNYDRTRWFTINVEEAQKLTSIMVSEIGHGTRSGQNDTRSGQNDTRSGQNDTTIPDTLTDTLTDTPSSKEEKTTSEKSSDPQPPPMQTHHDPEAEATASEKAAKRAEAELDAAAREAWIAALEAKLPPPPAPPRDDETYRAELQATEERMLARAAEEPWHAWGTESKQVAARSGVSREVIQRVGHLLESDYGLRPPWDNKPRMKHWVSGLAELYKASDGDLEVIAEAADLLRQKDYAMNKPQSLYNTVSGIAAKRRSGASKRRSGRGKYAWAAATSLPEVEEQTEDEVLWERILAALRLTMTAATFNHLLLDSYPARRENGTLTVTVRSEAAVAGLERMPAVGRCVERVEAGLQVIFEVKE